jgi:predicted transcriptional regulator
LSTVKSRLKIEGKGDFFEELNHKDQAVIDEALEQLENGEFISHDSVREEIKNRFNF